MLCITVGVGWAVKIKEDAESELGIPKDSVKLFATVGMSVSRSLGLFQLHALTWLISRE